MEDLVRVILDEKRARMVVKRSTSFSMKVGYDYFEKLKDTLRYYGFPFNENPTSCIYNYLGVQIKLDKRIKKFRFYESKL